MPPKKGKKGKLAQQAAEASVASTPEASTPASSSPVPESLLDAGLPSSHQYSSSATGLREVDTVEEMGSRREVATERGFRAVNASSDPEVDIWDVNASPSPPTRHLSPTTNSNTAAANVGSATQAQTQTQARDRRPRTDSSSYKNPAQLKPAAPVPPEPTPAWPTAVTATSIESPPPLTSSLSLSPPRDRFAPSNPSNTSNRNNPSAASRVLDQFASLSLSPSSSASGTGALGLSAEPMYHIRNPSDVSVGSDGLNVVPIGSINPANGETLAPTVQRRLPHPQSSNSPHTNNYNHNNKDIDTVPVDLYNSVGSAGLSKTIVPGTAGGALLSTAATEPPVVSPIGYTPYTSGRIQGGVYIHSLPSASEAEAPSSSSESDRDSFGRHGRPGLGSRYSTRAGDLPGHVARPSAPASRVSTASSTLDSMSNLSNRIRRKTSSTSTATTSVSATMPAISVSRSLRGAGGVAQDLLGLGNGHGRSSSSGGNVERQQQLLQLQQQQLLQQQALQQQGLDGRLHNVPLDNGTHPNPNTNANATNIIITSPQSASDVILWARWDSLDYHRRFLVLGYAGGAVQLWDVTELDAVYEVLNLPRGFGPSPTSHPSSGRGGHVRNQSQRVPIPRSAVILPAPSSSSSSSKGGLSDAFRESRPLLGVLLSTGELVLYSLAEHEVVKRVQVAQTPADVVIVDCSMQTSGDFVAIATLSSKRDVSIHILSSHNLTYLYTFQLSSSSYLPAYSLSQRFLTIPLPPPSSRSQPSTSGAASSPALGGHALVPNLQTGIAVLKDGASSRASSIQMDVATTARGVWSGVSAAASSALTGILAGSGTSTPQQSTAATSKWPFSRSAPSGGPLSVGAGAGVVPSSALSTTPEEERLPSGEADQHGFGHGAESGSAKTQTQWIALYDLAPLLESGNHTQAQQQGHLHPPTHTRRGSGSVLDEEAPAPFLIAHFPFNLGLSAAAASSSSSSTSLTPGNVFSSTSSISSISISPSGSLLAVADADGGTVKVYHVRSRGVVGRRADAAREAAAHGVQGRAHSHSHGGSSPAPSPSPRMRKAPSLSSSPTPSTSFDSYGRPQSLSSRARRRSSGSSGTGLGLGLGLGTSPGAAGGGGGGGLSFGGVMRGIGAAAVAGVSASLGSGHSSGSGTGTYTGGSGAGGVGNAGEMTTATQAGEPHRNVWHVYDLVRGVTRAKVESIVWSNDERWVGVGTAAGTVHIFATNPYGGLPDEDSHLDGRVRNIKEFQPLSTVLPSLARIHTHVSRPPSPMSGTIRPSGPLLSFTFPPISTSFRSRTFDPRRSSSPAPPPKNTGAASTAAPQRRRQPAFQDVLLTIPSVGRLELHRGNVIPSTAKASATESSTASGSGSGGTAAARAGKSSSPPSASPGKVSISLPTSGLTNMMQAVRGKTPAGLGAKMVPLATWDVRKDGEWDEVKGEFKEEQSVPQPSYEQDWLSEAELSTATTSTAMLPDSIYLSHQFTFHAFTDDWQAPLHRGQFDIPTVKIDVRKEVEASAAGASSKIRRGDTTESFIQDPSITGSPFDEPLATAIHGKLEPIQPLQNVLPSYPNGLHVHPNGWRDAATPLRHAAAGVADGVGGGLGRLRRELGKKTKSPKRAANTSDSLVFDEGDNVLPEEADEFYEALGGAEGDTPVPPPKPLKTKAGTGVRRAPAGDSSTGSDSTLSTANAVAPGGGNAEVWDDWRESEVADDVAEYEAFETFEMDEDHQRHNTSQQLQSSQLPAGSTTSLPPASAGSNVKASVLGLPRRSSRTYPQLPNADGSGSVLTPATPPVFPPSQTRLPPPIPPPPPAKNTALPPPPPVPPGAARRRRPGAPGV